MGMDDTPLPDAAPEDVKQAFEDAIANVILRDEKLNPSPDPLMGNRKLKGHLKALHDASDKLRGNRGKGPKITFNSVRRLLREEYSEIAEEVKALEAITDLYIKGE